MLRLKGLDAEAAYLRLPIALQNAACTAVGWRTEHTRYNGEFESVFAEALARSHWPQEQLVSLRDARLRQALARCAQLPFYASRFREAGVAPGDVRSLDDLRALPILTKDEVRQRLVPQLRTSGRGVKMQHTSGTTGGSLRFPTTMSAVREVWATWWRFRSWHGIERGTWCGLFAGRSVVPAAQSDPPYWRLNLAGRQVLFSGYHMSAATLPAYVAELRRRQPPWLHGYPSLLALLAAHLAESGDDLGYQLRWVTTGAENLLPHQVDVIERGLGVRPIQHYGQAEAVANVSQCEQRTLHVDEDFSAVEFVPLGRDGLHRIVGTGFVNPAMPLVRYDTKDLATISEGATCSCGRAGRIVDRIDGRLEDYVVLSNGTKIGRMDHVFKDLTKIREAQIHQSKPGEITLRVVRADDYTKDDEAMLLRETQKRVGAEMRIEIDYVNEVERSTTGKLRFVVSEIDEARIAKASTAHAAT